MALGMPPKPSWIQSPSPFLSGDAFLYDFVDYHPRLCLRRSRYTNDPYVISKNDNVVSVNASLQIDLTGQVCAESIGPKQHSGTGGATDFAWGAYHSKGGRAILAQSSTTKQGTLSRIVPTLDPGAIVSVSWRCLRPSMPKRCMDWKRAAQRPCNRSKTGSMRKSLRMTMTRSSAMGSRFIRNGVWFRTLPWRYEDNCGVTQQPAGWVTFQRAC